MTNANSMHEAGLSKQVSGTTQRDEVGREVQDKGTHVRPWLVLDDVWQKHNMVK